MTDVMSCGSLFPGTYNNALKPKYVVLVSDVNLLDMHYIGTGMP